MICYRDYIHPWLKWIILSIYGLIFTDSLKLVIAPGKVIGRRQLHYIQQGIAGYLDSICCILENPRALWNNEFPPVYRTLRFSRRVHNWHLLLSAVVSPDWVANPTLIYLGLKKVRWRWPVKDIGLWANQSLRDLLLIIAWLYLAHQRWMNNGKLMASPSSSARRASAALDILCFQKCA